MSISKVTDCLWDAVTFRGVCDTPVNSTMYINDIPAIDNLLLSHLLTNEAINALEVWNKVKRRGIPSFYNKVVAAMADKFVPYVVVDNVVNGEWIQPFENIATANKFRGVRIDLRASENYELNIRTASFYSQGVASGNITIYDLETGSTLDTIAYNFTAAGFQTVNINKSYTGDRFFVAYDAASILSRKVTPKSTAYWDNLACVCRCPITATCREIDKTAQVIDYNLTGSSDCGMILKYNIGCSLAPWICQMREQLCGLLVYHLAAEMFLEVAASKNIIPTVLANSEQYDSLVLYVNTQFDNLFKSFFKGVKINDPLCVKCEAQTVKAWFRP